jgi:hypothetical protein
MSLKNISPMPDWNTLRSSVFYDQETGHFYCRKSLKRLDRSSSGSRARIFFAGGDYYAHRLAWFYVHGQAPKYTIDHINEVPDDNRIANLQDVPHRENLRLHWARVRQQKQRVAA